MSIDFASYARRLEELDSDVGFPFTSKQVTNSTNDDAMAAARDDAPHGSLFVAESQLKGRGRRGASWHSAPGQSLTFSLLLRPELEPARVSLLSLVTGLAVRHVLSRHVDCPVLVKWPNDVLASGRKIAGILVESQLSGGRVSAVVVGVGLNLGPCEFPPELRERAVSLHELGVASLDAGALLGELVHEIATRIQACAGEGTSEIVRELQEFDALLGKRVDIDGTSGVAAGIGADGSLLVDTADGRKSVISGTVVPFD
jgi:BirA family transcriptional regulator, biotin operon repressor / biotin---[acetyl-CoA-carboxylase] ligase